MQGFYGITKAHFKERVCKVGFFSSLAWIIITFLFFTVMVAVISSLKTKEDNLDTAEGYFLASRSLPGVVIAGSLLLTNLSAEQLVGLNGQSWATNMSPIWHIISCPVI